MAIIVLIVQNRPRAFVDEDGELTTWPNVDEAMRWLDEEGRGRLIVEAAESIIVLDCATGEMEYL